MNINLVSKQVSRWAAAGLVLVVLSQSAQARLDGEVVASVNAPTDTIGVNYVLRNTGGSAVSGIELIVTDRLQQFNCAGTSQGNSFSMSDGQLAAGDSVSCQGQVNRPANGLTRIPVDITALGTAADGTRFRSNTGYTILLGGVPADEAIGTILTGAVHNDNDGDFLFTTNDTIDYRFTVVNTGQAVLNNIVVSDDLMTTITCPAMTLAIDSSFVCTSTYTIPDNNNTTDITNVVTLTADGDNGQPVQDDDGFTALPQISETGTLNAAKVPAISDDATPDGFASVGDEITYSIIITNANADDIVIDSIVDMLPGLSAITCDAMTQGGIAFAGVGSNLPAGDTIICEASLIVTAMDRMNGQINNTVEIDGTSELFAMVNISAAATVVVPSFQLVIEKISNGGVDSFDFAITNTDTPNVTLTTTMQGTAVASANLFVEALGSDATITETLPMFYTLDSAVCMDAAGANIPVMLAGTTVTIDGDDLNVGGASTASPITCTFTNSTGPDIDVSKTVVDGNMDGVAEAGEQLDYTITLTNNGGGDITYAAGDITDTVPANTTAVGGDDFDCAAMDPAGTVCGNSAMITVPANNGTNPGVVALSFSVLVDDPIPQGVTTISNSVVVPGECPNVTGGTNDCDEDIPVVGNELDLAIVKVASQNFVRVGDVFSYDIMVSNISMANAPDTIVTDNLPPELSFISTAGCNNDPDGVPVCELGDLAPGDSVSYTINVELIAIPTGNTLENIATASSSDVDVDTSNNTDNAIVGVLTEVPTLSTIGLLILMVLAALTSVIALRRRQQGQS